MHFNYHVPLGPGSTISLVPLCTNPVLSLLEV